MAPATFTETEPNDTFATANAIGVATGDILTTAVNDWLIINGEINPGGDADFYQFTIGAKSGLFFDIDAQSNVLSSLDSFLQVYDSTMTPVANGSNDNGYDFQGFAVPAAATMNGTQPDSSLYLDLPAGTYYVSVTGVGGTTGAYELRMLADSNYAASVPSLTSNPTAADTLYLDFDGNSSTTDAWATTYASYTAAAFDFDGNLADYSPGERLAIQNIWKVISEDYSPFKLKVTTLQPANFNDGVAYHQVITSTLPTSFPGAFGFASNLLGVTFTVGSYASNGANDNVGFTFASNFSSFQGGVSGTIEADALEQGNTTAHEFGHALGLKHYASTAATAPNPPATVAPSALMATPDTGLNREIWTTATNESGAIQDDMAIISGSTNTFGYNTDDYGNSIATASAATTAPGGYKNTGVIAQVTDRDVFRFTASGPTTISVDVDDYINDLDTQLRVYNSSGVQIGISDDPGSFDGKVSFANLPQATYYVEVRGSGNPGDAGQFALTISTATTSVQVYKGNLVVTDTTANGKNDNLFISLVGGNVRVHDPNNQLAAGPGSTQVDANTVDTPLASILGKLLVNTLGGNDTVTLDFSTGNPIPPAGMAYDGGVGTNTLVAPDKDNLWILSALDTGKIDNLKVSFVNVQNLTGGTLRDVFHFNVNGRVSGTIDGSPGNNWLDYSGVASGIIANLATGVVSRVAKPVHNFNNVIGSAAGGDKITGDINGGVLLGHGKGNQITAGDGPTIIIGGYGVNTLQGGSASDLIIDGRTAYDGNFAKLEAILAIWQSGDPYLTRIANIQASANPLTVGATVFLSVSVTPGGIGPRYGGGNFVYLSTIFGNADSDWFFTKYLSTLFDRKPGEVVTTS